MCGRFVMARAVGDLVAESGAIEPSESFAYQPDYNLAPTKNIPVVIERSADADDPRHTPENTSENGLVREIFIARWGLLPIWAKDPSFSSRTFNARSESVVTKPSFRSAVKSKRCAIPADGYYEWLAPQSKGGKKQPYFVRPRDGSLIFFAGLYDWWKNPEDDSWVLSATILTGDSPADDADTEILRDLSALHSRLPLAMNSSMMNEWLSAGAQESSEQAQHLVDEVVAQGFDTANGWEMYPVSSAVGNVRNNGPELLEPMGEQDSLL